MSGAHLRNRKLAVWRRAVSGDGAGGQTSARGQAGEVWAQVCQPSIRERTAAAQLGVELTHVVYLAARADVQRGDELRGGGQALRVLSTIAPSALEEYLRADCEQVQPEGVE